MSDLSNYFQPPQMSSAEFKETGRTRLSICYSVLLSLCMPLNVMYLYFLMYLITKFPIDPAILMILYIILAGCYILTLAVLGILCVIKSFALCRQGLLEPAAKHMRIHKYGLVIFFVVNFICYVLLFGGGTFLALVASRGILIFTAPVTLPILIILICLAVLGTWLAILPGSFYSICVIRILMRAGRLTKGAGTVHGILQFLFVADVFDAVYLSRLCRKLHDNAAPIWL